MMCIISVDVSATTDGPGACPQANTNDASGRPGRFGPEPWWVCARREHVKHAQGLDALFEYAEESDFQHPQAHRPPRLLSPWDIPETHRNRGASHIAWH